MKIKIKIVLAFIIGLIVSGISVYAVTQIAATTITYDNTTSGLDATTAQAALDELNDKIDNRASSIPVELLGIGKWGGPTSYSYVAPEPGYYLMFRGSGSDTPFTFNSTPITTAEGPYSSMFGGNSAYSFKLYLFHATSAGENLVSYSNSNPSDRYAPSTSFWKLNVNAEPTITKLTETYNPDSLTQTNMTSDANVIYLGIEGGEYYQNSHPAGYWLSASEDSSLSLPIYDDIGINIYQIF